MGPDIGMARSKARRGNRTPSSLPRYEEPVELSGLQHLIVDELKENGIEASVPGRDSYPHPNQYGDEEVLGVVAVRGDYDRQSIYKILSAFAQRRKDLVHLVEIKPGVRSTVFVSSKGNPTDKMKADGETPVWQYERLLVTKYSH